jgi:hypothetical protein
MYEILLGVDFRDARRLMSVNEGQEKTDDCDK